MISVRRQLRSSGFRELTVAALAISEPGQTGRGLWR
jgi:hypothetical protein